MTVEVIPHSIIVPVRGRDEYIEIFDHELPRDSINVITMLRTELAPLEVWIEIAIAYYVQGCREQFRECHVWRPIWNFEFLLWIGEVLTSVVDAFDLYTVQDLDGEEHGRLVRGRLRILSMLARSAASEFVSAGSGQKVRDSWRLKALEYMGRADKIVSDFEETWISKALFWIGEARQDIAMLRHAGYYADLAVTHKCTTVGVMTV